MKIIQKIFYLFFPILIGGIVSLLIANNIDYEILNKPFLSPPGFLFPIIWSIIYLLLGISYYLFKKNNNDTLTSIIYYVGLFVNALWSIIFFVWKMRFLAVIWILLLLTLVVLLIYLFSKKNKVSAYLNILYLLWIIYATYLTIGVYILN